MYYETSRKEIKARIKEENKDIRPKDWQKELDTLKSELETSDLEYAKLLNTLAAIEIIEHNKKEFSNIISPPKSLRDILKENKQKQLQLDTAASNKKDKKQYR